MDHWEVRERIAAVLAARAEAIAAKAVRPHPQGAKPAGLFTPDEPVLTPPKAGLGSMVALLVAALWLTLVGANYPSALLGELFSLGQQVLSVLLSQIGTPPRLAEFFLLGVYRSAAWVVAVMLPPMAIFFPAFTLLEDLGYLPRVAFALDRAFAKAGTQGKQALTMCLGLGCNATGVACCRIMESPRERLIASLTNVFMPCNGRFPTMIALASLFLGRPGLAGSIEAALVVGGLILGGVATTLVVSWFLARTLLRGLPSAFVLEIPPYRRPRIAQVLIRSLLDRTLFVLTRAVAVAAPAGGLTWLLTNTSFQGQSLLVLLANWLSPLGRALGLDGFVLTAFLLGWPANEIVLPILLMGYLSAGSLVEVNDLANLHGVLTAQGWTWLTALCFLLFSLLHFPCATTVLTLLKETGGRWAALGFFLPLGVAMAVTFGVTQIARLLGLA